MDFNKVRKYKKASFVDVIARDIVKDKSEWESFLFSGVFFRWGKSDRETFFKRSLISTSDEAEAIKIEFLLYAFGKAEEYWEEALGYIAGVSAEDVLSYFEYVSCCMLALNISLDGKFYPDDIIGSQHDFLLSTLPVLSRLLSEGRIPYQGRRSCCHKNKSKKTIERLSHYHSLIVEIVEVSKGHYSPKPVPYLFKKYRFESIVKEEIEKKCSFFLERNLKEFGRMETYRDLNYRFNYAGGHDVGESFSLMEKAGFARYFSEGDTLYFDMNRGETYLEEVQFEKVEELLEQIYGDLGTVVEYKNETYKISDFVRVAQKIYSVSHEFSKENQNNLAKRKSNFIKIFGWKALVRKLELELRMEPLIALFAADLDSNEFSELAFLPIFRCNNLYYFLPSHVANLSFEKVIDKILSGSRTKVLYSHGVKKGYLFEERIVSLFDDSGYQCGSINRDHQKNIPEIDAVVSYDESSIFVIEAKCTVKPESRHEAHSYFENHLSKAIRQLFLRYNFISQRAEEAEERLSFPIKNKRIIPLVVSNHSYFTGMDFKTSGGVSVHCIDELLLSRIIKSGNILSWRYCESQDLYLFKEKLLTSSDEIVDAIIHPSNNLENMSQSTIQFLESGIAFEISKHAEIDWDGSWISEMNVQ